MTQPRTGKILSALGFNKARTGFFFLGGPYTSKRVLPIKVWITPYKRSISPRALPMWDLPRVLYTPSLGESVSSLRFVPPSLKRHAELL